MTVGRRARPCRPLFPITSPFSAASHKGLVELRCNWMRAIGSSPLVSHAYLRALRARPRGPFLSGYFDSETFMAAPPHSFTSRFLALTAAMFLVCAQVGQAQDAAR